MDIENKSMSMYVYVYVHVHLWQCNHFIYVYVRYYDNYTYVLVYVYTYLCGNAIASFMCMYDTMIITLMSWYVYTYRCTILGWSPVENLTWFIHGFLFMNYPHTKYNLTFVIIVPTYFLGQYNHNCYLSNQSLSDCWPDIVIYARGLPRA